MPSACPRESHVGAIYKKRPSCAPPFFLRLAAAGGQAEEKRRRGIYGNSRVDDQHETPPGKRAASKTGTKSYAATTEKPNAKPTILSSPPYKSCPQYDKLKLLLHKGKSEIC